MSEWLKPKAVAEELDVSERTLADWRYEGRGPAYIREGRVVRYRRADLERWATSRRVEGAPLT